MGRPRWAGLPAPGADHLSPESTGQSGPGQGLLRPTCGVTEASQTERLQRSNFPGEVRNEGCRVRNSQLPPSKLLSHQFRFKRLASTRGKAQVHLLPV